MDINNIENTANENENEQNVVVTEAALDETSVQESAPSTQQIEELQEEVRASEPTVDNQQEKITSLFESMNKSILDNLIASQESFLDLKNEIRETHELNDEEDYEILNKNDENENQEDNGQELNEKKSEIEIEEKTEEITPVETIMDILGNGSLIKTITKHGEKDKRPRSTQICTIDYSAFFESNNAEVERAEDFQFILDDGDVVPALNMAISLMNLNEECEIKSEPRHAYGEKGNLPTIPPNAKLIFQVTLKKFEDAPEMRTLNPLQRMSLVESKKTKGNFHYNRQSYDLALQSYKRGLRYFYEFNLNGEESEEDLRKFAEVRRTILMNVALSNFKLELFNDALEALDEVLTSQNRHLKALFIKGKVLAQVGNLSEAIKCFNKALEIDEKNADIKKELNKVQARYKIEYDKEKQMYQKMLTGVTTNPKHSPSSEKKKKIKKEEGSNKFGTYLTATGIIVAIASITIAAFAKYKNLI